MTTFRDRYAVVTLPLTNEITVDVPFVFIGFKYIYLLRASDNGAFINLRIDSIDSPVIPLYKQYGMIDLKCEKFFITAPAQAGKSVSFIMTETPDDMKVFEQAEGQDINEVTLLSTLNGGATPSVYNKVLTLAATEYSQALPATCKRFIIRARGADIKLSFTSGASGTTYLTIPNGAAYNEDLILYTSGTLYMQSATAGAVAEVIAWA